MPITNQRAADGRCDVRRSDVILLILCRSTCVHGALLTTLPLLPFLRGEISVKGRTPESRRGNTCGRGRWIRPEADSRWRETRARCSKTSRAIVTVILTPAPLPPTLLDDETLFVPRSYAIPTRTPVEYRNGRT